MRPTGWRKRLRRTRDVVFHPVPLLALAALVFLALSDQWTTFWQSHGMAGQIVASIVLLVAGASIFEEWHEHAQEERWERVGNICLKALAQSVTEARDTIVLLTRGTLPFSEEHPPQKFDTATAQQVVARVGAEGDVQAMLADKVWVRFAYASVRQLAREMREAVARWAPIMIDSDRLCAEITRVGHLGDAVEDIHRPLGPSHRDEDACVREDCREVTAALLDATLTFTVVLEERLVAAMGRGGWQTRGRELLGTDGERTVAALDSGLMSLADVERDLRAWRDDLRKRFRSAFERAHETGASDGKAATSPLE